MKDIYFFQSVLGEYILGKEVVYNTDITGKLLDNIKPVTRKFPWRDLDGNVNEIEF